MKILWLTNIALPCVNKHLHPKMKSSGLWMEVLSDDILSRQGYKLYSIYQCAGKQIISGSFDQVSYTGFPAHFEKKPKSMYNLFYKIIEDFEPDVIHIWGAENVHANILAKVCRDLSRLNQTIVDLQGIAAMIADQYTIGLPARAVYAFTIRDMLRRDNIALQKRDFLHRGELESETLSILRNAFGRTDFDRSFVTFINPGLKYYHVDRIMRNSFYTQRKWQVSECRRHSIFLSQAHYPIKGMHILLEAIALLKHKYPDLKLNVAGFDFTKNDTLKEKLKLSSFGRYIKSLINEYDLKDLVFFTGNLNEQAMLEQYLSTHVFVSPSTMENLSNSTMEAMILGVPVVSSDVGGMSQLVQHKINGYLYPASHAYLLAYYIDLVFQGVPPEMLGRAIEKVEIMCARSQNIQRIHDTYEVLSQSSKMDAIG